MIQCKEFARGRCGGELCMQGRKRRCSKYQPARTYKAFGYEVTVQFYNGETKEFHWCGLTESAAKRKGMLKTNAKAILSVEPVAEDEWIRAFGVPAKRC